MTAVTVEKIIDANDRAIANVSPMSDGILAVIARAATDPNVDIDKMERLLEMQERVMAREARVAFTSALAALQPRLPVILENGGIKDRSGNIQSKYALWEDINDAIKPILAEGGFALSFKTRVDGEKIIVTGILSHIGGHSEQTELGLPSDTSGSKNAVQAIGSSTSYGKRYTALALLNITSRGEDDNGRAGGGNGSITREQFDELDGLADSAGADKGKLAAFLGVESLRDLPFKDIEKARRAIAAKRKQEVK